MGNKYLSDPDFMTAIRVAIQHASQQLPPVVTPEPQGTMMRDSFADARRQRLRRAQDAMSTYFEPGFDDSADEPDASYVPTVTQEPAASAPVAPFSTPPVKLADHVSKEAKTNQSHTEAPGKSYAPPVSNIKPSVLVSTPTLGGLRGNYFNSALNLLNACTVRGMKLGFSIHEGNSFIQSARNTILREFLKSSYSHLLMLDDDIGYNASDIMRMLDADVDFICGAVPMRQFNLPALHDAVNRLGMRNNLEDFLPKFNVNILDVQSGMVNIDKTTGAMEIAFAGTACILIKRCVAERMLAECVGPFKVDSYKDFQSDGEITYNFFDCFIDETNQLNGEDVSFCKRWRSIGGRIFCLPDMKMSHHGPMTLTGNFMNSLMPAGLNK